ncbi:MAG: DUF3427 domain-containing protein, partial [Propionibacteriaceae bacterium]|nr:DUF3427 domain-containing protein [Propionibacteriaceae bacterium]
MDRDLPEGFYDSLVTHALQARVEASGLTPSMSKVEPADLADLLAHHVRKVALAALEAQPEAQRVEVADNVISLLGVVEEQVAGDPRRLESLLGPVGPGRPARYSNPPETPLSAPALLTNARGEPSVGSEIASELGSADRVELLCAFIKWHGLRTLEKPLAELKERGVRLRVITSTYLGSTEREALDRLVKDFDAEIKVSYETQRTRLHAKAWRFIRNTGFDTAYVGSSNLSRTAMLDGVEWNVRLTHNSTPELLRKFAATFDTYWNDPAFETYTPADGDRLAAALDEASGRNRRTESLNISGLEVRPWPHQERILEALEVEREVHGRHRNLIVAATGTGKTVVAALDYERIVRGSGRRPSLLFVAHRREILEQSLKTYREVLADGGFGELLVGEYKPQHWQHVFASVQSLSAERLTEFDPDGFEIVVIDEFHHAEASSYRRILDHFRPKELLGLTATPERADGVDVRDFFDKRAAYELRLWDALDADLLSPFHYFGIADSTDLSTVDFRSGRYDVNQLSGLFTGDDARTRLILQEVQRKIADPWSMRALGFCVSVAHAQYMAAKFTEAGLPSKAVHGDTPTAERRQAVQDLKSGAVVALFTADLFNEGIDIPDVDTVLFLRPTESATIFLQQLGRGLRRTPDKAVLTVLDFVGHQRKEFNLAQRYRSITGGSRKELQRQVEKGFPYLPAGSQIVLDRGTQKQVLDNVKRQLTFRWKELVHELRATGDVGLVTYLDESGVELPDLLRGGRSFTQLRREAGFVVPDGGPREEELLKRLKAFAHVDDRDRHAAYSQLLADDAPAYADLDPSGRQWAQMLLFSLWPTASGFESFEHGLESLRPERAFRAEAQQVLDWAFGRAEHVAQPLGGPLRKTPLRSHARYTREELYAAIGHASPQRTPGHFREGVLFTEAMSTDSLLITLHKTEDHFSPTTMYRDYAINSTLFHWESQSTTSIASKTGQRYLNQRDNGTDVLLYVRNGGAWEFGKGAPYVLLGQADYVEHRGEKPIAITWQL